MLIEIVASDSDCTPIRNKETGEVRFLKQIAYVDLGQAYPARVKISVAQPLDPGVYRAQVPYRVGKYESLEISAFDPWVCQRLEKQPVKGAA